MPRNSIASVIGAAALADKFAPYLFEDKLMRRRLRVKIMTISASCRSVDALREGLHGQEHFPRYQVTCS